MVAPQVQDGELMDVWPYSFANLCEAIAEAVRPARAPDNDRYPLKYFKEYFEYFEGKGGITVVIERHYIDHDFMEDNAAYYVRCFLGKYPSYCTRLHFFNTAFSRAEFYDVVAKKNDQVEEQIRANYLGFTVIKPLPKTFIGRTCLKVYDKEGRRNYPVISPIPVHLMGLSLEVESIPFQQQDTVVAACATSALWSLFHVTGRMFHHSIPSPAEITKMATSDNPSAGRGFPNRGLTYVQVSSAIRQVGLEPDIVRPTTEFGTKATIYGYLKEGFPILLSAGLYDTNLTDTSTGGPKCLGLHAVGITGYDMGPPSDVPHSETGTLFRSNRMEQIYAHDDQVGPFARLTFQDAVTLHRSRCLVVERYQLAVAGLFEDEARSIQWASSFPSDVPGDGDSVVFVQDAIVIPLYHKIRIPIDQILTKTTRIDLQIKKAMGEDASGLDLDWDVFLTTAAKLKESLRREYYNRIEGAYLTELLRAPMPRFIWRTIARVDREPAFEFWYDATDIEQGDYLLRIVGVNTDFIAKLTQATDSK